MSAAEARARQYLDFNRYEEAQKELAIAIGQEPDHGELYSLMALCLLRQRKPKDALKFAERGIAVSPEAPYVHYILAFVYQKRKNYTKAEKSALEAIRLDPYNADYFSLYCGLLSLQGRWQSALDAADHALTLDPNHAEVLRLRAQALSFMGKTQAAKSSARQAIAEDPDSASGHTEIGWINLRAGDHRAAEEHFKEALRLNPMSERAREGLLESLRSRFLPYRLVFQFWTFISRFPTQSRTLIMFGLMMVLRLSATISRDSPALMPFFVPVAIVVGFLSYASLFGRGVMNVVVLLHPLGRLAMTKDEKTQARMLLGFFGAATILGLVSGLTPLKLWGSFGCAVLGVFLMSLLGALESSPKARGIGQWVLFAICGALTLLVLVNELAGSGHLG